MVEVGNGIVDVLSGGTASRELRLQSIKKFLGRSARVCVGRSGSLYLFFVEMALELVVSVPE